MNKNVENYKKAVNQIHASQDLKDKVLENVQEKNKKKTSIYYFRYVSAIAAVAIVAVVGVSFANKSKNEVLEANKPIINEEEKNEALAKVNIKRFQNTEELREVLEENKTSVKSYGIREMDVVESAVAEESMNSKSDTTSGANLESSDYSRTNNQVENVDEADIVKTDGKFIYYSRYNRVYIVDKELNLKATIEDENFSPNQIFVNGDKLVVFGNINRNQILYDTRIKSTDSVMKEDVSSYSRQKTEARVYNIKNRENPKLERQVSLDGYYKDARMIGDNVYFISNYSIYYYRDLDELKDYELLPSYKDSFISEEDKMIEATDIACFKDTNTYSYSIIAGFSLDSKEAVNIETFFGAGNEIYVSENNMYIVTPKYGNNWYAENSNIYKFKLDDSNILAVAEGEVEGYVNNQFSIDEYKGNLRVATTSYKYSRIGELLDYKYDGRYSTHLTILDENLEKIGEIEDLVKDEEIYAVRFIGKVGYIVTFEEVDPLWVIDLSDPTNPVVKGALEIPGYSSYLHPYDETHIIGIGYNVKDNGYGGVMNDTIKMSMFDVSDLNNPKELFNVSVGSKNSYSNIMYEHKALFFNKEENLIGFPISSYYRNSSRNGIALYRIDLENNEFEEISDLVLKGSNYAERAIYIGNNIYVLSGNKIVRYDLETFEEINSIELKNDYRNYYWD